MTRLEQRLEPLGVGSRQAEFVIAVQQVGDGAEATTMPRSSRWISGMLRCSA